MYPTISHLIEDLFGVYIPLPIQTFGFFVAVAFLLAAYIAAVELKRKEQEGLLVSTETTYIKGLPASTRELIISALIGFVLGYKLVLILQDYSTFAANPQAVLLSLNGNWIGGIVGAAGAGFYRYWSKERNKLEKPIEKEVEIHPHERIGDIALLAAFAGLIGAKLFHNLEYYEEFMQDPLYHLFSFSGLTFYGGLIFGTIAVVYYARKHDISIVHLADSLAPALILAYGVGRIGCQLAGDGDWGIANTAPQPEWLAFLPEWVWHFDYPHNVLGQGVPIEGCEGAFCARLEQPVYPTPFYESVMCIFLFGVLWVLRKRIRVAGVLFCIYLIFNGIERYLIEKIRVNAEYNILGFTPTQAEIIAPLLVLAGLAGIWYLTKHKNRLPAFLT